mmetsp:Transcript_5551/g.6234  ORF Transcript_5551/g.6234 Transcript_5551/m.6234 type:complete len:182 (-) Transcript_5551:137-682(-)
MATVQITVPHNADVGDMLTFSVGGRELEIPIPEGTKPGDVLEIQVGNDEIDEEKSTGSTDHNNYCGSNSNGNDEEFSILLDDDVGVILNIQSSCKKSTVTEEEEKEEGGYLPNAVMAFMCVSVAALAAGLTMGLMSQEVLDLRIKELAASNISERKQAKSLIPLVSDRHRLKSLYLLIRAK